MLRCSAASAGTSGYGAYGRDDGANDLLRIFDMDFGGQVGSSWSGNLVGTTVKISANGTTIKAYVNGTERISCTDASTASGGYVGFENSAASTGSPEYVDNFEAGEL